VATKRHRRSGLTDAEKVIVTMWVKDQHKKLKAAVAELRANQHLVGGEWCKSTADYYDNARKWLEGALSGLRKGIDHERLPERLARLANGA